MYISVSTVSNCMYLCKINLRKTEFQSYFQLYIQFYIVNLLYIVTKWDWQVKFYLLNDCNKKYFVLIQNKCSFFLLQAYYLVNIFILICFCETLINILHKTRLFYIKLINNCYCYCHYTIIVVIVNSTYSKFSLH